MCSETSWRCHRARFYTDLPFPDRRVESPVDVNRDVQRNNHTVTMAYLTGAANVIECERSRPAVMTPAPMTGNSESGLVELLTGAPRAWRMA